MRNVTKPARWGLLGIAWVLWWSAGSEAMVTPNGGSLPEVVRFWGEDAQARVFFVDEGVVLSLGRPPERAGGVPERWALWLRFDGGWAPRSVVGEGLRGTRLSFFLGDEPSTWTKSVWTREAVRYVGVHEGRDVVFRLGPGWLSYTVDGPVGSPVSVEVLGAERLEREEGRLVAVTPLGTLEVQPAGRGGVIRWGAGPEAESSWNNPSCLLWGTFLGGTDWDEVVDVAVAADGTILVTGFTESFDFPTTPGAYQEAKEGRRDVFVARLSADGDSLRWGTYVGGGDDDYGRTVLLDPQGRVLVVGQTRSPDFPTTPGAYDTEWGGGGDVFVLALSASGSDLLWATYLGGADEEETGPSGAVLAGSGEIVVTGGTTSLDFPTTAGVFQPDLAGDRDAFLAALSADGSQLVWSGFLGGTAWDQASSLALASDGDLILAGTTLSADFPVTPGAYATSYNYWSAFVARIPEGAASLEWASFLGGSDPDEALRVLETPDGGILCGGYTYSLDFPITPGVLDETYSDHYGDQDFCEGFLTKFAPDGTALVWSTYLGGTSHDVVHDLDVSAQGEIVAVGRTGSFDFPVTPDGFDTVMEGLGNGFISLVSPSADTLLWGSFFGGDGADATLAVASVGPREVVVAGVSYASAGFPVTEGSFDPVYNGDWDGFVACLRLGTASAVAPQPWDARDLSLQVLARREPTFLLHLARGSRVDLAVFDASGRRVDTVVRGWLEAGRHEVRWRIAGRAQRPARGIYFARAAAGQSLAIRRFLVW
jgi:hypothetical protein